MPATIDRNNNRQIIAGVFSNPERANQAVHDLRETGFPDHDIQVLLTHAHTQADFANSLVTRGASTSQAHYYDREVKNGKVMVTVYNIKEPGRVIDILDNNGAEYNPNGSRNLRDDVLGMTLGTTAGVVAGGLAGSAVAGPVGTLLGAAAGAIVGGSAGIVVGKANEHSK